jgi:hypothetical protein
MPGGVPAALARAAEGVALADRSRDAGQRVINRTAGADALHQSGLGDDPGAQVDVQEGEAIATRSGMRLPLADLPLRIRLNSNRHPKAARKSLVKATAIVAGTADHRRDAERIALAHRLAARTI